MWSAWCLPVDHWASCRHEAADGSAGWQDHKPLLQAAGRAVAYLMQGSACLRRSPAAVVQACLDVTLPYCVERKQFGHRLGDFQMTQAKLADMYTATEATRSYLYSVAAAADAGAGGELVVGPPPTHPTVTPSSQLRAHWNASFLAQTFWLQAVLIAKTVQRSSCLPRRMPPGWRCMPSSCMAAMGAFEIPQLAVGTLTRGQMHYLMAQRCATPFAATSMNTPLGGCYEMPSCTRLGRALPVRTARWRDPNAMQL